MLNAFSNGNIGVLMLNYEFPPLGGGSGNANFYLLKEFSKLPDLRIDLVTSSVNKYRIEKFSENITIHFLDISKAGDNLHNQSNKDISIYLVKAWSYARMLQKQNKFDLCHAFFSIPCGFIAMNLGLSYIVSLRGSDVPFHNNRFYWPDKLFFQRLNKIIWNRAKVVIANSEGLKELAQKTAPAQEFIVINNGVDVKQFQPHSDKNINRKVKLISIGRLVEQKGYIYLLEAIKNMENVELALVGDGNLMGRLKAMAEKKNINVTFLGMIEHDRVADYLREANIFVLPSLNEGMSNAILEAMACGLPIIATDTGGSRELITDNGFIIEKGSIKALERAISIYLDDHNLINEHGSRSRLYAERMSWDNIAKKYLQAYLNCV